MPARRYFRQDSSCRAAAQRHLVVVGVDHALEGPRDYVALRLICRLRPVQLLQLQGDLAFFTPRLLLRDVFDKRQDNVSFTLRKNRNSSRDITAFCVIPQPRYTSSYSAQKKTVTDTHTINKSETNVKL